MTTLVEHMIVAGAENRPPMLDKTMYNSWQSRMLLYIKGKKNGRMMLESIENGPLVYPTIEKNGAIRPKKFAELTKQEKLQDDCDVQATNIILQGLLPDVYSLVNHCQFDKFTSVKDETLYEYYWRFAQLINDMHTIGMTMQQVQHECCAKDIQILLHWLLTIKLSQILLSLAVPVFLPRDDPIACLNKAMAFMLTVVASRFPSTKNQLRTSSNPRNQATIQDGRVTVQQVQGRQRQSFAGMGTKGNATSLGENNAAGQARVIKCYNCQGEGNMARQCTKPKRPRNSAWFKEKMLLVQAQESSLVLDEEHLAFLLDSGIPDGQAIQITIPQNAAFQTDDLDAYDFDCDDISSAKAVLMANLSSYDSDVLFEVPQHDSYQNDDMINQSVQKMQNFEQSFIDYVLDNKITSDSNIISYEQYLKQTQNAIFQDTNSSAQQDSMIISMFEQMSKQMSNQITHWDKVNQETKNVNESLTAEFERYKERVKTFEQSFNGYLGSREKLIDSYMVDMIQNRNALKQEIDSLNQTISKQVKEKESLLQTFTVFKKKAQRIKPTLYDEIMISKKHDVITVVDEKGTLILEKESRSKILAKQNDLILKEHKINISPINNNELNKLAEDFGKRFVPQMQMSIKQALWLPLSNPESKQLNVTQTPTEIGVPKELPKVFKEEVIPFINSLRASFKDFENGLHSELNEVKTVFNQMEAVVDQCSVDKKYFDIQKKELSLENDRLLDHIICQDVMNIVMHTDSLPVNVIMTRSVFGKKLKNQEALISLIDEGIAISGGFTLT
ncbi:retrovirus-related pol polyprotein from transposon TNT 1-94, partial [Tanacetum coccineum]